MEKILSDAIAKRDAYLASRPHLNSFQDEIDLKLSNLDNPGDRMAYLGVLIEQKLNELRDALKVAKRLTGGGDAN